MQIIEETQVLLKKGDWEHGFALLLEASELARAAGETIEQGIILNNLGLAQNSAGQILPARETLLYSLKLLENTNSLNEAFILNNLGLVEQNLSNLDAAEKYYEMALKILEETDEQLEIARTLTNLGLVCKDQNQLTEARAYLEKASSILENYIVKATGEQEEPSYRGHVLSALALVLERLQDFEGAADYYLKARDIYIQAKNFENEAVVLHNLGQLYHNQNEWMNALEYYFQSLTINLAYNYQVGRADNLSAIAALICQVKQAEWSLNQQPDSPLHNHPIKFSDIISAWVQVVKDALVEKNLLATTTDLELLVTLAQIDSLKQVLTVYEHILSLQKAAGYRLGQMKTLIDLGLLNRDAENFDEAVKYLTKALVLARETGYPDELYNIYLDRGDVLMMAGQVLQATEDYAAAVDVAESIRARLLLEEEALDYFAWPNLVAYDRLVRIEARLEHTKQALFWAEQAKSREFLRRLQLSDIARPQHVPQALINQEVQLITQARQTAAQLQATDQPDLNTLRNYETLENNLHQLWGKIEQFTLEYVALRQGKPISWEELQKCLQV